MINNIHSLKGSIALLIAIMTVTIVAGGFPISVNAADKVDQIADTDDPGAKMKTEIRKQEEKARRLDNKSHRKQAKSLAKQYQQTAEIVAKQGGDPAPLLNAADYYLSQSR